MIRQFFVFIALVVLVSVGAVGCKKAERTASQRLVGTWLLDVDASMAEIPEEKHAVAEPYLRMLQLGMEFSEQGALIMRTAMQGKITERSGRYAMKSGVPDGGLFNFTLVADTETSASAEDEDVQVTFRSDDQLVLTTIGPDGQPDLNDRVILRRVSKEAHDKAIQGTEPATLPDGASP